MWSVVLLFCLCLFMYQYESKINFHLSSWQDIRPSYMIIC
uniref:Uncharacterized protein n=1 Tax=Setaria viridis TaxID=4556 RepID=A0A4U6WHG6_SETVI|nr:hypothetical protein SEVIR_1G264333v2 [Setaria viridis]